MLQAGASAWTTAQRQAYANDLVRPQLWAVTDNVNESKGDSGPEDWKPPLGKLALLGSQIKNIWLTFDKRIFLVHIRRSLHKCQMVLRPYYHDSREGGSYYYACYLLSCTKVLGYGRLQYFLCSFTTSEIVHSCLMYLFWGEDSAPVLL